MNRDQFIEALRALTGGIGAVEREKMIEYYTEMIDDRVEAGMSEEQAVAALGDPKALVREFLPDPGMGDGTAPRPEPSPEASQYTDPTAQVVDALREIHIHMKTGDALIRREPPANGAAAQLQFSDPQDFEWRIEDGVLVVTENPRPRKVRFLGLGISINGMNLGAAAGVLVINLADISLEKLIFDSHGGDAKISDVHTSELLVLSNSSGDIEMTRSACDGRVEINVRSGDVNAQDCVASGDFKIEAISGDVALRRCRADTLRARATSGDIEIERCAANTLNVNSVSGDVRLDENEIDGRSLCETSSGDIEVTRPVCPETHLSTASGDIEVQLLNRAGGYALNANTRSGDIELPRHWEAPDQPGASKATINAQSLSGDIQISILE